MNIKGTYLIDEYFNFTIKVDYEYYYKAQTHEDPFEDQLDIKKVRLNDVDITRFYWDYLNEDLFEKIYEHVVEFKIENLMLQKERVKEKEYYLKRSNTSGTID